MKVDFLHFPVGIATLMVSLILIDTTLSSGVHRRKVVTQPGIFTSITTAVFPTDFLIST
jgi:hypothetical protein